MQNETVQGIAPAAARGAIAHDVRLCVACLHENRGGEKSCEACGTSLFLILCGACEAANSAGDVRCHGCGAALGTESSDKPAEPAAAAPPASEASLGPTKASDKPEAEPPAARISSARTEVSEEPETAPPVGRMSLVRTEARDEQAEAPPARRANRWRSALILAGVVVTTAGVTHHFSSRTADRAPQGKVIEAAAVKSVEPPPRAEPKAGGPNVTHTQPADASQTAPSAPVTRAAVIEVAPVKSVEPPRRAPPPRTEPRAVTPAGGPSASVGFTPQAGSAYPPVTHTQQAAAAQVVPAAVVPAAVVPATTQKSDSGCGEAVAALGLCNARAQSGGK
jgi:hypothetical protein